MFPDLPAMNYWAILVAALAYWLIGAIWYAPALFGNVWLKLTGKTLEQAKKDHTPVNYIWALVTSFLAAYGIARICLWTMASTIWDGIVIGFLVGICFVLTAFVMNDAFENRPKGLTIINVLYHLFSLVVVGIIIGAWR